MDGGDAKICMVSTAGGHLAQLEALRPAVREHDAYLVTVPSPHAASVFPGTRRFLVRQVLRNPANFLVNFVQSLLIVLRERPDVVLTTGAGDALATFFLARALGARTIFLESLARVQRPSAFGRLAHRWANLVLVQWPELMCIYQRAALVSPIFDVFTSPRTPSVAPEILVLTGTHVRGFERLLAALDDQVRRNRVGGRIRAQIGHSTYVPRYYPSFRFLPHAELLEAMKHADIIITHDGAGSMGEALSLGKVTIVVPRRASEGEVTYASGQQLARYLAERGLVSILDAPEQLPDVLKNPELVPKTQPSAPLPSAVDLIRAFFVRLEAAAASNEYPTGLGRRISAGLTGRRIAIISPVSPWDERPSGVRVYVDALSSRLAASGVFVNVLCPAPGPPAPVKNLEADILPGPRGSSLGFLAALIVSRLRIRRRVGILHFQRLDHVLPFVFWCPSTPKVVTLHGETVRSVSLRKGWLQAGILFILEALSSVFVQRLIAVDAQTKDTYERSFPWLRGRIEVIPVGVWLPEVALASDSGRILEGIPENAKIVLFAGRLSPEKNANLLLESFRLLLQKIPDAYLLIVGDGPQEGILKDRARSLGLFRIRFVPTVDRPSLVRILRRADVLAISSLFESGPLVALEAVSLGTPIVSTSVGRVPNLLAQWDVGLVAAPEPSGFAAALARVVELGKAHYAKDCAQAAKSLSFDATYRITQVAYFAVLAGGV